jgi:hypothetical protein
VLCNIRFHCKENDENLKCKYCNYLIDYSLLYLIINRNLSFSVLGTRTIYIKTWGCSHNNSDSEYMAGQLSVAGYTITGNHRCSADSVLYFAGKYSRDSGSEI